MTWTNLASFYYAPYIHPQHFAKFFRASTIHNEGNSIISNVDGYSWRIAHGALSLCLASLGQDGLRIWRLDM